VHFLDAIRDCWGGEAMSSEPSLLTRRAFLASTALAMGAVAMAPLATAPSPKSGGTLRVAFESDITGGDPYRSRGIQAGYVADNLYNNLVTIDPDLNILPDLAESWEVQEGGRVYLFRLHRGVRFHDGTPCDAEAVQWNLTHVMDPESNAAQTQFFTMVEAVEVVDAQTLKVRLKYPSSVLLPALAIHGSGGLRIISPTAYQRWGKDFGLHPVGTGPFRLGKWEQNQVIVLEKNPDYFKPALPSLDGVELKIMKDGVTRVTALRAGEVDCVNWVPREHAKRLEQDAKIRLWRGPETTGVFLVPTLSRTPWDDLRVRRAVMGYGLDREAMAKAALLGYGRPLVSLVSHGLRGHVALLEMYPYNPEKAKALLNEAGFDEKNPLRYGLITHAADPVLPTVGTIMKTQLEKIGVQVTMEVLDRPVFLKRHLAYDRDQTLVIAYPRPDLYSFAYVLEMGGLNVPNHRDRHVNELFDQMRQALSLEEQDRISAELQRYLADQMLVSGLVAITFLQAGRADVKDYTYLGGQRVSFETTRLDRA
jgi:ABC-type transport system substrate-binding protein